MAKKWSDVAASAAFQALSFEEQEEARRQYFEAVIAPQVPSEDVSLARDQFFADTALRRPAVDTATVDYGQAATDMMGGSVPAPTDRRGLIQRVGDLLRPAPKPSVLDRPATGDELQRMQQADIDRRLSYGAGPIRPEVVTAADQVRSTRGTGDQIKFRDPSYANRVGKVVDAMDQRGELSSAQVVADLNRQPLREAANDLKAEEFRSVGEWAADTLSSLSQGVVTLAQLPVNIIAPSSSLAESMRQTQKELQAQESDVSKASRDVLRRRVENEDGFLGKYFETVKQLVTNPTLSVNEAVKQVPMFLGVIAGARLVSAAAGTGVAVAGRAAPTVALADAISGGAVTAGARAAGSVAGGLGTSMAMAGGDAAGNTYETLTDPRKTPLSDWKKNPDFQRLVEEGKTEKEAIQEIATTKARMAALITAPLGVLGYMGTEAAVASRGLGRAAADALTPKGAAKLVLKDNLGEQGEEGGTQLGSNLVTGTVNQNQDPFEGVAQAMATAGVTSTPMNVLGAASQYQQARQQAQARDPITDALAIESLRTDPGTSNFIRSAATVKNFTPAGSPTQQAGLVDIVVPIPGVSTDPALGDLNVGATGVPGGLAGTGGVGGSGVVGGGLGTAGLGDAATTGSGGGTAPGAGANDRSAVPAGGASDQSLASLTRPFARATDADLLTRTEAAVAGQQNNNADTAATKIWAGRGKAGYANEQDAEQAMATASVVIDTKQTHDWRVEPIGNGRFQIVGYQKGAGLENNNAQVNEAAGQAVGAADTAAAAGSASAAQAGTAAPFELSDSERAGLRLAPPAPASTFTQIQGQLAKRRGVTVEAVPVADLTDSQRVASAVARLMGNTLTVVSATAGNAANAPNAFINRVGGKHIFIASNADDAPVSLAFHEGYHGLPTERRKALNTALLEVFNEDQKGEFLREFNYTPDKFEEEAPAMMAQAISKRADFWEQLRDKMGNREFGEVAKVILSKLNQVITGAKDQYGEAFVSKYIKDVVKARDLLTTAYAESMQAQGFKPDAEVSGQVMASERANSRIGLDFKDVVKRTPELQEGMAKLQAGEITKEDYDRLVNEFKPVEPYKSVPDPVTPEAARFALANGRGQSEEKAAKFGLPSQEMKTGDLAQLRLDIPSYSEHGAWVVSVHRPEGRSFSAGKVVGYEPVASVQNASFGMLEKSAAKIAAGSAKGTIATILGDWKPTTPKQAKVMADQALKSKDWVQVGMDPERHSYFYDRATMEPVTAADEVIQIGPLVLAKNPTYGDKSEFMFSEKSGFADETDLSKIVNSVDLNAPPEEKVRQLVRMTDENVPIVKDLMKRIDERFGTQSKDNKKKPENILIKATRPSILAKKPWHGVEHIRDSYRFKTDITSVTQLPGIVQMLEDAGIEIIKRDTEKVLSPGEWGWRIAAFDLRMPNGQLVEYYLPVSELEQAKKEEGHHLFEQWRNYDVKKLTSDQFEQYQATLKKSQDLYQSAWDAYLARTGDSDKAIRAALARVAAASASASSNPSETSAPMVTPSGRPDQEPAESRTAASPLSTTTADGEPSASIQAAGNFIDGSPDKATLSQRLSEQKTAGRYTYTTDAKGRIIVSGDTARIKFLTRKVANGTVVEEGVRFKGEDLQRVLDALSAAPTVNAQIAQEVAAKLSLTPQELASTSLEYQTGLPKDKAFVAPLKGGLPEVVKFLEERRLQAGLPPLDITKPEDQETVAKLIAAETLAAIRSSGNALQWYDETIARTLAMIAVKYPELQNDRNAQMTFRLAMAISSQGLDVESNLNFAMAQYDAFRKQGKFPESGQGEDAGAMAGNFALVNDLLADMGPDMLRRFLVTSFTVEELRSAGFSPEGELGDERVLGSSVLGPKIGFGFYSNLNGNFEPVTMDMWFMRLIGRLTGALRSFDAAKYGKQLDRFRAALDQRGTDGVYADSFDPALVAQARTNDDAALRLARQVNSVHQKDFRDNRAAFDNGTRKKSQLVYAAGTMLVSADKSKDAPANGSERRQLRAVVSKAVAMVEQAHGQRVPPAAMQALVWYPEQELYKAMGVKLRVTSQDYAGAAEKILKDQGYAEQQLKSAAESGSRLIQQQTRSDDARGNQAAGTASRQVGPLEGAERARFLRERYERTELAKERVEPKRKGIVFEVAPDPNNERLVGAWRALSAEQRREISNRVARQIVPRVLAQFETDGIITSQVGSYLDDTNPSFTLLLNKGDVLDVSRALGFVLAQDSMMVVSPKSFKGGSQVGAIFVNVGDKSSAEINEVYQKLREIRVKGEQPVGGQSYANGRMIILNYSDVSTDQLAILIDQKLNKAYSVETGDVYSAFPEKKEYDYASEKTDPRGGRADLRRRARALRAEATAALEAELRDSGIEFSNRTGSDAAGGGRDRGVGQEDLQGSVTPSYGTPRDGASSAVGYHYSRQSRNTLSSAMYGTGLRGAELERLQGSDPRLKQRVYFYIDRGTGINPEAGVGGYAHRVNLQNLYDVDEDALRLRRDADGFNAFEAAVLDAGFDGYMVRDAGPSGNAVLLGQHAVPVEQLGSAGRMQTADAVPAARDRVLNDAEKISANRSLPSGALTGAQWAAVLERQMPEVYGRLADAEVWASAQPMYRSELMKALKDDGIQFSNRRLPKVSPQSALEADIASATEKLTRAIQEIRRNPDAKAGPKIKLGRLPHVLNMLGARTQDMDIARSIVYKVFLDPEKHRDEFASVTPSQFVRALYRPAMVLQSRKAENEMEMVLPITGDKGAVIVPVVISRSNADPLAGIKSAYQYTVSANFDKSADSIMRRVNEGALRYVDMATAGATLTGRANEEALTESGPRNTEGLEGGFNASGRVPTTQPPTSLTGSITNVNRPVNDRFVAWPQVAVKMRELLAQRKIRDEVSLMRWIGDNYKPESSDLGWADAPAFSNRAQTNTPEFKRWFGDSKVVDAEGQPLVVYHGTSASFDEFASSDFPGWFSASPELAERYLREPSSFSAPNIMPVYLSIKRPLRVSVDMNDSREAAIAEIRRLGFDPEQSFNTGPSAYAVLASADFQAQLFDRGYDGLVVKEDGVDTFAPVLATQIKSAIGNSGAFDPDSPDITASNRRQRLSTIGQNFTLPAATRTDDARRVLQDDALRMKRVLDAVKAKGGTVGEAQNFYDANTLMPGRIQAAIDDFRDNVIRPLTEKAAKYGIDFDELSLFAYAKHAQERNEYIASINPRMPDGGSGMKTADANQILQQVASGPKAQQFEELHKDLMAITSTTRQLLMSQGLITQDEFDALDGQYENYIPLRGLENVDDEGRMRPGVGRGVNVRGQETVRAMGRRSQASDLIENVIRDYERVISRVEKNDVGKVLLDFVLSNPDPDLWGVDVERSKPAFNKATGLVQYTKQVEKGEDTIGVKVGGQQVYIKLADKDLARALRQAWKDETSGLERATLAMTGWWNNWLRAVLTRYNPAFAAINIPRDALWSGTASALAELGASGLVKYLAAYPKAFMASARREAGVAGTNSRLFGNVQMDARFAEFRSAGGITGGYFMRSLDDIDQDLRNDLLSAGAAPRNTWESIKSLPPFKLAKLTLKMLEFMGSASENATRFALYQAARESGRSPAQAGVLAKDGTTNFNRKGEWGGALNNLYLFYNAGVQGTTQLAKVLKSPAVMASMAGVSAIGMMLALYGADSGGEDDDKEKYWDKIPSYVKERNIVIMLPPGDALAGGIERVGKRGRYITIPVQYGFNIFPNLGYVMADVLRNQADPKRGMTPTKAALHMTSTVFGSVNPFGGSVDVSDPVQVLLAAMPTLVDLPVQIVNERGTFGSPSAPAKSPFDKRPDSERMFTSQQDTMSAKIAKTLNEMGGGNEAKEGSLLGVNTSVTPGTIQTLISATTGGLGTFVEQMGTAAIAMTGDDKDMKANKIPFLNKFYGEVDEGANIRTAGERMREIRKLSDEVKAQQKLGLDPKLQDEEERILSLASMQQAYERQSSMLRKREIEIIKDPKMTEAQKKLERKSLQIERDRLATDVNREYLRTVPR